MNALAPVADPPWPSDLPESGAPIVLADPPWTYRDKANAGRRGAAHKYPTLAVGSIAEHLHQLAARDAVLFLWTTWPLIPAALAAAEGAAFRYRTVAFVWVKTTSKGGLAWGMGNWTRANTEPCLLFTRGRKHAKAIDHGVHQVIQAPRREHSAKPPEVRHRIVQLMGDAGPRLELYARERVDGWLAWWLDV